MNYIKKLFNSILPVLKYMLFSYGIIFGTYFLYVLFGGNDANEFLNLYASYILVVFNVIYIIILLRTNRILCKKTTSIIPFVMLGVGISVFCNMLIFLVDNVVLNDVVYKSKLFLICSSAIIGPIIEEIIFRYLLVNKLDKFNNKAVTVFLASFIFAFVHNGIFNVIYTFLLGIVLNIIYVKNKNLLYPIIIHMSANLISLFLTKYNVYILGLSFGLLVISMFIVKRDYLLK